jgi:hypothetical protein
LNKNNFLKDLDYAVNNPDSREAKHLMKMLTPYIKIAGSNIPYGETGASDKAFARMINNQRFFGNSALFFTVNPVLHDYIMALRIAVPISNNYTDLTGTNFIASSNSYERKKALTPIASSTAYVHFNKNLIDKMLRMPQSSGLKTTIPSALDRDPGVLGRLMSMSGAQETSGADNPHSHWIINTTNDWSFYKSLDLTNANIQNKIAKFLDSIITSEIPLKENDNTKFIFSDTPWNSDPNILQLKEQCNDPNNILYKDRFQWVACKRQDHKPHNCSCFPATKVKSLLQKKKSLNELLCRFALPSHNWNNTTGLQQIQLFTIPIPSASAPNQSITYSSVGNSSKSIFIPQTTNRPKLIAKILLLPYSYECNEFYISSLYDKDPRVFAPMMTKRTNNASHIRDHLENFQKSSLNNIYHTDSDTFGPNGYFVDCNAAITVATGAQNNIVMLCESHVALPYTCTYSVKSISCQIKSCLPLMQEAIRTSKIRPSVSTDTTFTKTQRETIRIWQRYVNNKIKIQEFTIKIILCSELGLLQFSHSHEYTHIFVHGAVVFILQQIDKQKKIVQILLYLI